MKVAIVTTVVKFAVVSSMVSLFAFALFFVYTNFGVREDSQAATGTSSITSTTKSTDDKSKKEKETPLGHTESDLTMEINSIEDIEDIEVYLKNLNLEEKYNYQKLLPMPEEDYLVIQFHNPDANPWQCDIFDMNGNVIRTYIDVFSDFISIDKTELDPELKYTYLLQDGSGTYLAGKLQF